MPNFEWRVFTPVSPSSSSLPGEIWSLIGVSPSRKEPERADVYLTCTTSAGLKLRDGKKVEVKLRETVSPGESEAWEKVLIAKLPHSVDDKDPIAVGKVFQENLRKIEPVIERDPGLKESLDNALFALNDPQHFVTVAKSRIKTATYRLNVDTVEEAIVTVSVGKDPVALWRTVCIEASKPENIDKFLAMKFTPKGGVETSLREYLVKGGTVEAYPEFIMQRTV